MWQFGAVLQRKWALRSGHVFIVARDAPGDPSLTPLPLNAFRSLLGDEPVRFIYVEPQGDGEQTIAGLKRLFPSDSNITLFAPSNPMCHYFLRGLILGRFRGLAPLVAPGVRNLRRVAQSSRADS